MAAIAYQYNPIVTDKQLLQLATINMPRVNSLTVSDGIHDTGHITVSNNQHTHHPVPINVTRVLENSSTHLAAEI